MYKWHNVFQPIFFQIGIENMNHKVDHYEMLLRDENDQFPNHDFFRIISTEEDNQKWIPNRRKVIKKSIFPSSRYFHVNLNVEPIQFAYPSVWEFLRRIYDKYGQKVIIEITERQLQAGNIGNRQFDCAFQRINDIGFKIALDDVDSGSNSFSFVNHHVNQISVIKLSLLIFDNVSSGTTISFIDSWAAFAKEKHLDLVIEAVRSKEIAKRFAGNKHIFQQDKLLLGKSTQIRRHLLI